MSTRRPVLVTSCRNSSNRSSGAITTPWRRSIPEPIDTTTTGSRSGSMLANISAIETFGANEWPNRMSRAPTNQDLLEILGGSLAGRRQSFPYRYLNIDLGLARRRPISSMSPTAIAVRTLKREPRPTAQDAEEQIGGQVRQVLEGDDAKFLEGACLTAPPTSRRAPDARPTRAHERIPGLARIALVRSARGSDLTPTWDELRPCRCAAALLDQEHSGYPMPTRGSSRTCTRRGRNRPGFVTLRFKPAASKPGLPAP